MKRLILFVGVIFLAFGPASAQAGTIWANSAGWGPSDLNQFDTTTGAETVAGSAAGNGRGVVQVGNVLYLTQAGSNNVYTKDATTLADTGVAFSIAGASGLQAIAYDGTDFWVGDYSGTNKAYKYSSTGTLLNTLELSNSLGYYDGLEYFNGKLIANRFDGGYLGGNQYSVYDATTGALVTANFIDTTGHGNGTGIAFDGTNFYVSDIENNQLTIWDGTTGAFISNLALAGNHPWIEDLSVDYATRKDTGSVPEPSTLLLLGSGLVGLVGMRKRFKA